MKIDFISDIHGYADELEQLLAKLGYNKSKGYYSHPNERQVIFVGDFIDRGPKIFETLKIVKQMCDNGTAQAVMGNHEYNAILFHTKNTKDGGYFRTHGFKEINQHIETLKQFQHHPHDWRLYLDWFKTLPLFIETEFYNVVHAYWNSDHVAFLKKNPIQWDEVGLRKMTDKNMAEYEVIEELLKGKEYKLPDGHYFYDKDNVKRQHCRVRWWDINTETKTYKQYLMHCPEGIANEKFTYSFEEIPKDKPIFFGHYWLQAEEPYVTNHHAVCLDYSVAKSGHLVAYSLDSQKLTIQKNIS